MAKFWAGYILGALIASFSFLTYIKNHDGVLFLLVCSGVVTAAAAAYTIISNWE